MNPLTLCLSIVPLTNQTHTPTPVMEIVQNRIVQQLKVDKPDLLVNFGKSSCPNVIHFEEELSSIKLLGNSDVWIGEKQISYTDALSDRSLDFDENLKMPHNTQNGNSNPPQSSSWKPWVLWTGLALTAGGLTYYLIHQRKSHTSNQQRGESVNLRQAITF